MTNEKKKGKATSLVLKDSAPKVTAVIPSWNSLWMTKRLVESIREFWTIPYKLVIVDNGSTDGSAEWIKKQEAANPDVIKGIYFHTNKGFVTATNAGMEFVEGHMLWLNADCQFVRPGTIETMVNMLEKTSGLGAIGPVSNVVMGAQNVGENAKYPPFHIARFLIGFCMLVKDRVWKEIGPLDPMLNGVGNDDLDYSIRIRDAGYQLGILRSAFVEHYGGVAHEMLYGGYGTEKFREMDGEGRRRLIEKHGEDRVNEVFLPVDFSGVRVMVCVPAWTSIYPEAYANHVNSFMEEMKLAKQSGMEILFAPMIRSAIVTARNELVRRALEAECTHLFFMDDDMLMPPGSLHKLVQRNKDIVSGLCHLRTPPHFPSAFISPPESDGKVFYIKDWWSQNPGELIEVDAVGSACVLIKTDVFEKIQETDYPGEVETCPHCKETFDGEPLKRSGQDLWYSYGRARPGENTVGEDLFFCKFAQDAGYKIYVDTTVRFGHIGSPVIYDSNYFVEVLRQNGDLPAMVYKSYDQCREHAVRADKEQKENSALTPGALAERMGGPEARRLQAGPVGDGRNPGIRSAAGNRGNFRTRGSGSAV